MDLSNIDKTNRDSTSVQLNVKYGKVSNKEFALSTAKPKSATQMARLINSSEVTSLFTNFILVFSTYLVMYLSEVKQIK